MAKFRKKPVVIDAVQWHGANVAEMVCFLRANLATEPDEEGRPSVIVIRTLEGDMRASLNDWVVKGVNGEFYPCKPDIFEKTYEHA